MHCVVFDFYDHVTQAGQRAPRKHDEMTFVGCGCGDLRLRNIMAVNLWKVDDSC